MIRRLSLVSLSIGTVLIVYGWNAVDSVLPTLWRLLAGDAADQTIWFIITGTFLFGLGFGGAVLSPSPAGNHDYPAQAPPEPYRRSRPRVRKPSWLDRSRK